MRRSLSKAFDPAAVVDDIKRGIRHLLGRCNLAKQPRDDEGDPIADEAVRWFVTMLDVSVPDDKRRAFAAWLARDPSHQEKWDEVARVWFLMGEALKSRRQAG